MIQSTTWIILALAYLVSGQTINIIGLPSEIEVPYDTAILSSIANFTFHDTAEPNATMTSLITSIEPSDPFQSTPKFAISPGITIGTRKLKLCLKRKSLNLIESVSPLARINSRSPCLHWQFSS